MSLEKVLKTIGRNFYVWFLTLSLLILSCLLITFGSEDNLLSLRIIGGLVLVPFAYPLKIIFKTKREIEEDNYKLAKRKDKTQRKKNRMDFISTQTKLKNDFKLEKLKLKSSRV